MKLLHAIVIFLMLASALVGCGTKSEPPPPLNLNPYTIGLSTDPAGTLQAGKPVILKAEIKGDQALDKNAAISFTITKAGTDASDEIKANGKGEGRYEGAFTFKDSGTYSVTLHLMSGIVHQMSSVEVRIQ